MKNVWIAMALILSTSVWAQVNSARADEVAGMLEKTDTIGWQRGLGIGLDFLQLLQINPKVGAGEDRIQFGGVSSFFANYKSNRLSWDNNGTLLFGVQRLGSGFTTIGGNRIKKPYQKTIDELRLISSFAYQMMEDSKWSYAINAGFLSQVTPTYPGNFLSDVNAEGQNPIARFLSPAQITIAPGVKYVQDEHFSVQISPATVKMIVVADDDIASVAGDSSLQVGLHGTGWRSGTDFDNTLFQLGGSIRALYQNKYFNDRFIVNSDLTLFSNYMNEPQNVDLDWRNEFAFEIYKGLQLNLIVNLFYDHDIPVQETDFDATNGVVSNPDGSPRLTRALNIVQTFSIKYNYIF